LGTEPSRSRHARAVAFTLSFPFFVAWASGAAAQTPNNSWFGGTDGTWSNGGNWTGSTPVPTDTVGFNVAGAANQPTLDVDPTVAGLLMNATGNNTLTLNGHTLTITGIATQSGGTITGTGTVGLTGSGTFAASGTAVLGNGVTISTAGTGNTVTLSGVNFGGTITGSGGLITNGSVIVGGGASTYTGGTTINAGSSVTLAATDALSSQSVLTNNGSLGLNGFGQTVTALSGSGSIDLGSFGLTVNGSGNSTYSGTITGNGDLTKAGTGILTLSGNSTYLGGTDLNGGAIAVASNTALGGGTLTMAAGTTLRAAGGVSLSNAISLAGSATVDTNGNDMTLSSGITGAGALTKAGAGTLTLSGTNSYGGGTTVGAGTLALTGSVTGNASVAAGASLTGTGTVGGNLAVSGAVAPGSSSFGTLNVGGTYTQNAGSTYTVKVDSAGQSDKIAVTGGATLNGGTVSVQAANGRYQRNTAYTILTATGGVSGAYAGVASNLAFLAPSLSYGSNAVTLSLLSSANSFQSGARTANQAAVGAVLDRASPTATGDFATVLNAIYGLDTVQGPRVLDALSGQNYAAFGSLMMQGSQVFMDNFQVQAGGGQSAGGSAGLSGSSSYMALKAGDCDNANACDVEPLWGVWGGGIGALGTVAGSSNAAGASYSLGGFMAGIDRKFGNGFRAGVATGFNAASIYTQGMPGYGTSNTLQFAVYGEYMVGAFYLDGLAGYAHSENRLSRPIVIPGLAFRTAQGFATANTFFGQLEAGYKIVVAPSFGGFVTPFARLQGTTSTQDGFTETGADSLNLTVAAQSTNSLRSVLGAQFGASIDTGWREKLAVVLRLGWSHEFGDVSRPVNASFLGAPSLGFTTFGSTAPRDGVVLGLGANTAVAERTRVYLRYDGDLAGTNTNHVLTAGVRYVW